jgi:YgiT-type zinc finger domain-containing protein
VAQGKRSDLRKRAESSLPKEKAMKCVICKVGETKPGKTAVTLERGKTTLVLKGVPAQVCTNCGEAYLDEEVSRLALQTAEEAVRLGVQVDVREFAAVAG